MTMWFQRTPGAIAMEADERDGEPGTLLIAPDCKLDWVRLPPDLGGERVQVVVLTGRVALRAARLHVRDLLEHDYGVAECLRCAFSWYKRGGA